MSNVHESFADESPDQGSSRQESPEHETLEQSESLEQIAERVFHHQGGASPVDIDRYGSFHEPMGLPTPDRHGDQTLFLGRIGQPEFPAEPGRYHLFASYADPASHRVLLVRALKGLRHIVGVSYLDARCDGRGWAMRSDSGFGADTSGEDFSFLKQVYDASGDAENSDLFAEWGYRGRITAPVLWDSANRRIVSNYAPDIAVDLATGFNEFAEHHDVDLYPRNLRSQMDSIMHFMAEHIAWASAAAGFARRQAEFDAAATKFFEAINAFAIRLQSTDFMMSDQLTDADLLFWVHLIRLDLVYGPLFGLMSYRLSDFPSLFSFTQRVYANPEIAAETQLDQIVDHYWSTMPMLNPRGIVPALPQPEWIYPLG